MYKILPILLIIISFLNCTNSKNRQQQSENDSTNFVVEVYEEKPIKLKEFKPASTYPYYSLGRWGYANKEGEIVIDAVFEKCGFFSEGHAWIVKDSKYGIIDKEGEMVIKNQFDDAGLMKYGFIPLKKNNLWGFLDAKGNQIIPFQFEDYEFKNDSTIHVRQNRQWGIINLNGSIISLPLYDRNFSFDDDITMVSRNGKKGVIDHNGEVLIECKHNSLDQVDDTLFIAEKYVNYKKSFFGLISTADSFTIPQEFRNMKNIS